MDLGQVFTRLPVAEYMVSLLTLDKNAKVLDPCFGEGAFLNALTNSGWNHVYGYEIDSNLFTYCKNEYQNCILSLNVTCIFFIPKFCVCFIYIVDFHTLYNFFF